MIEIIYYRYKTKIYGRKGQNGSDRCKERKKNYVGPKKILKKLNQKYGQIDACIL